MTEKLTSIIKTHKKILIITASGIVLVAAILTTVLLYINQNKSSTNATTYREYAVTKGDVTVGTSETGTVALDEVKVTFPVAVTIDSAKVKAGYKVKTGDTLVTLKQSSITTGAADSLAKLASAKISLEAAISDQGTKLKTAKLSYETSKQNASNALVTASLAKSDLANQIATDQETLKENQADLTKYLALQKSFSADYAKLQQLKKWRDDAQTTENSYSTQLTNYQTDHSDTLTELDTLKKAKDTAYGEYLAAKASGDGYSDEKEIYTAASDQYNEYYSYVETIAKGQDDLKAKVALYTAEYNNYSSAYNDFNDTYSMKYGITSSNETTAANELATKVTSLQSDVKNAQYALDKAQKSYNSNLNSADQTMQSSIIEGSNAQATYDLTVDQLAASASSAQASYDSLTNELADVESAIKGNGAITAPCDGIIVSVTYTDGQDVAASDTIVTIAKTKQVDMTVSLSEDDITEATIGQTTEMTLTSYDGLTFPGKVISISTTPARTGSSSVTYTVTSQMTGDNTKDIYIGMSGEVNFIKKQVKNVLYVADQAITFQDGVSSVLVKNADGTQTKTTVVTGFSNGRYVEILSGLKEGDTVLAESTVTK
jgi:HlyD family secretion protein